MIKNYHTSFYEKMVIGFSKEYDESNRNIENYITYYIALSEQVRMADSNSKHILRQLFKAFYNDITLLPDNVLIKYFNGINNKIGKNKQNFLADNSFDSILNLEQLLDDIIKNKIFLTSDKKSLDMKKVVKFNQVIKLIEQKDEIDEKIFFINAYLETIGYYIASLNDNDAKYLFKKIYK